MKYICETFNSIDQLIGVLDKRPVNRIFDGDECSSQKEGGKFSGTANYAEAVDLIKNGWDEPVKELKKASAELRVKANGTTTKTRPRNSVIGYAPCVPAAILGLPESMIATERTPTKIKAVTLVYCSDASANAKTKDFLKAGAVVLNIVNELELKGYRVRLINEFNACYAGDEAMVTRVTLKDWRQPLDLKKITFPLAHASMTRRFSFRYTETQPQITSRSWASGYGAPLGVKGYEWVRKAYKEHGLLTDNEYYINLQMVQDKDHDMQAVMKEAGMNL